MKIDAIILSEKDNVATALRDIRTDEEVLVGLLYTTKKVLIHEDIPYGHKFAVREIAKGGEIFKYGEVIGRATVNILPGTYAHIQNIESLRGRGDWEKKE